MKMNHEGTKSTKADGFSSCPSRLSGELVKRVVMVLAVLALATIAAAAQQSGPPKPYLDSKEEYQIFVIGDSLAAGLWSGLTRAAADDARLSVDGRYKEDSGLARPEYYDWNDALPKILESNSIDIAVVMIGSNDGQDIRDGNVRHVFGSPEWSRLYAAEVDRLIESLKNAGAAVYWVELPPMAADQYESEVRTIATIQAERAKVAGVKLVGTRGAFGTENGGYTDKGFDQSGEFIRLRSRDGVHFLKVGNTKLGGLVLDAIRADIEAADGKLEAANPSPPEPPPAGPAFGQPAAEGGETMIYMEQGPELAGKSDPAKSDAAAATPAIVPSSPGLAELARTVRPESSAARLFTLGEVPPAKPGRFDDFRVAQ